jgi:hypothetical protein
LILVIDNELHLHLIALCYNYYTSGIFKERGKNMKKLAMFLHVLVVSVLLSALPAISSSGPFGVFGPADNTDTGKRVEISQNAIVSGTGPYGAVGFFSKESGVVSMHVATSNGSGPYGAFASNGLITDNWTKSMENKEGCILVASNCPPVR